MSHIYKYCLPDEYCLLGIRTLQMPAGARILTAQMQASHFMLWAAVDISAPLQPRSFCVLPTGGELPEGLRYIATLQESGYVWHVFEKLL